MSKFFRDRWVLFISSIALILPQPVCSAQARDTSANQSSSASDAPISPAVQKQLDAMEKRIEELEAQLKVHVSTVQPLAADQAAVPTATATSKAAAESTVPSSTSETVATAPAAKPGHEEPFAFADWTWLNGNPRTITPAFDSKFFTPEIRADVAYHYDFNHPKDDTIGGSSEVFRSNEISLTDLAIGGDFHYDHVRARALSQIGLYSTATPRNDSSYSRGQWDLADAYRYVSEAYGGYHWDAMHGVNLDAGIFISYIGLFSYYKYDNWAYQPSYVSSNTPWFFTACACRCFRPEAENRALANQRLAVLRAIQRPVRFWRPDSISPEWPCLNAYQQLRCR